MTADETTLEAVRAGFNANASFGAPTSAGTPASSLRR